MATGERVSSMRCLALLVGLIACAPTPDREANEPSAGRCFIGSSYPSATDASDLTWDFILDFTPSQSAARPPMMATNLYGRGQGLFSVEYATDCASSLDLFRALIVELQEDAEDMRVRADLDSALGNAHEIGRSEFENVYIGAGSVR